jgi:hypothetical protein
MFGWRVEWEQEPDWYKIHGPGDEKVFEVWEPVSAPPGPAVAFVHPLGAYLDPAGTAFLRAGGPGPFGEFGWLLDLLREQTGLPWTGRETVKP